MTTIAKEAHTHDSIPTRAYWVGFVEGKLSAREDFNIEIPTSGIGEVMATTYGHAVDVDVGQPRIGAFTVSWTKLEIRFIKPKFDD